MKKYIKGFTLIEILIVIAIIGILSTISVTSYNRTRSSTELSLSYDQLVTDLRGLKSKATNISDPKCIGLKFENSDAGHQIYKIEAQYSDPITKCNLGTITATGIYSDKKLEIAEMISLETAKTVKSLEVMYYPPKGTMYFTDEKNEKIQIKLSFNGNENSQYIIINPVNGSVQKTFK